MSIKISSAPQSLSKLKIIKNLSDYPFLVQVSFFLFNLNLRYFNVLMKGDDEGDVECGGSEEGLNISYSLFQFNNLYFHSFMISISIFVVSIFDLTRL